MSRYKLDRIILNSLLKIGLYFMSSFNTFVFDIETVPDINGLRKLHDYADLSDDDIAEAVFRLRREKTNGSEFLPYHLQKVVAISVLLQTDEHLKVWSLGSESSDEKELITRFYSGIEKYRPVLVSWNGKGFDMPVLNYRALVNGVSAPQYWEQGDNDKEYKWNNYINRFHCRHLDVMDMLAGFQAKAFAPLDEIATLINFPGKMGYSGADVWQSYQAGDLKQIRHYCETDVLNTYGVYLRFELLRGQLNDLLYNERLEHLKHWLTQQTAPHFNEFFERCSFI